jgi:hypothetical protein
VGGTEWPTKEFRLGKVIDIVTLGRGQDYTLNELNRIASITALTIIILSYMPPFTGKHKDLIGISLPIVIVHWLYSMNKYFGFNIKRIMDTRGDMKISLVSGNVAIISLVLHYLGKISAHHFMMCSLLGSVTHYLFMKYSQNSKLDLKLFGYLPLVLAGFAIYHQFKSGNFKL